jgi:hypothetical protein
MIKHKEAYTETTAPVLFLTKNIHFLVQLPLSEENVFRNRLIP